MRGGVHSGGGTQQHQRRRAAQGARLLHAEPGVYQAARDLSPTSRVGRGGTIRRRCGPPPVTLSDPPSVQFARPGNVARSPRVPCRPPVELLQAMNLQGVSAEKPFSLHQAMSLQGVQPG